MLAVISSIGTVVVMAAAVATATASPVVAKSNQAISVAKHVDCERQCPYYYFPICATNGISAENRMFVNICEMHAWNCDVEKSEWNPKWTHYKFYIRSQYGPKSNRIKFLPKNLNSIWHANESVCTCCVLLVGMIGIDLESFSVFHWLKNCIEYRRTRNNQCKDYKEYVNDAWLESLKPKPKPTKPAPTKTVKHQGIWMNFHTSQFTT